MYKFALKALIINFLLQLSVLAAPELLSSPMLGYVEHREAMIWLQTKGAKNLTVKFTPKNLAGETKNLELKFPETDQAQAKTSKAILENLKPNTLYSYEIYLDGLQQKHPEQAWLFKTKRSTYPGLAPADFSFLTGSCAYLKDDEDLTLNAPGYGENLGVYGQMASTPADFMLWLGDNVYFRSADYSSASGMDRRYAKLRQHPDLAKLWPSKSHYAIWDDHDYGPNDSNSSFELKERSRNIFVKYWGNPSYGEGGKGIYTKFSFEDADFFLLDDRYFRDASQAKKIDSPDRQFLGKQQLAWLKNGLLGSNASFKFIVVGSTFLNDFSTYKEAAAFYPEERKDLLAFLDAEKIPGVMFLSGDRHYTEMIELKRPGNYALKELVCSPLSSMVYKDLGKDENEMNNPLRIAGTLVFENNFCKLSLVTESNQRFLEIKVIGSNGAEQWSKRFKKEDFSANK